jgi:four helix bundle protein
MDGFFRKLFPTNHLMISINHFVSYKALYLFYERMRNYKKYEVWRESHELVKFIYRHIAPCFPRDEKYELTSQMKRAAYSIPFNIVEGCGRNSDKDFTHFLDTALGSANELEYCILLTSELGFLNPEMYKLLNGKVGLIRAMLINLIKSFRQPKSS